MTWKLFLDDERVPTDAKWMPGDIQAMYRDEQWEIARTHLEVMALIELYGTIPEFVSFDHDLGDFTNGDGVKVARYLIDLDMYTDIKFPKQFQFVVHSRNPVGKANIEGLLNGYLKQRG